VAAELSPCGAIARRHDPDRFLCALFAPAEAREALFVLIAANHELARAREVASEPLIGLMRLAWWRETAEQAAAGAPPRRHEVAGPLAAMIRSGRIAAEDIIAMAEAREAEFEAEGLPSEAALHAFLRGTAGRLAIAMGRALDAPPALLPALEQAGALHGLAALLRGRHRRRQALLPAGADPVALARGADVAAATAALSALPRPALPAALPLVLARRDLARLAKGREGFQRGTWDRLAVTLAAMRGRV
jgi:phytoene synthase